MSKTTDRAIVLEKEIYQYYPPFRIPTSELNKLIRLRALISPYYCDRAEAVAEFKAKQKKRLTHLAIEQQKRQSRKIAKKDKIKSDYAIKQSERDFRLAQPVVWACQSVRDVERRTGLIRRIPDHGLISGDEITRIFGVCGIPRPERSEVVRRLVVLSKIERKIGTKQVEQKVKTLLLAGRSRIAGAKQPLLDEITEETGLPIDRVIEIYRKLSTAESVERRRVRAGI